MNRAGRSLAKMARVPGLDRLGDEFGLAIGRKTLMHRMDNLMALVNQCGFDAR